VNAIEQWAEMARIEQARRWAIDGKPQVNMRPFRHGPTGMVEEKTIEMMRALTEPMASDDLADAVGITCKSVGNRMSGLLSLGWVQVVGKKARTRRGGGRLVNVWDLTKAGREFINANS
jgi:predicted ArsR family transcriptional regulator